MIGVSFPITFRILLTVSIPFISGICQSIIYALNSFFISQASFARSTASLPEVVQSASISISRSILQTLIQVLASSSTTSALSPCSSPVILHSIETINSEPFPTSLFTVMVPPIILTMFLEIAIPRPVPWIPLFVTVCSLANASKICS